MRRSITITVAILLALWLISLAVLLLFLAGFADVPALVIASVISTAVLAIAVGLLIIGEVHRATHAPVANDLLIDELRRGIVVNGAAYGRRKDDDLNVIDQMSRLMEEAAAARPGPHKTPNWFADDASPQDDSP